jgi:hypothetical protein
MGTLPYFRENIQRPGNWRNCSRKIGKCMQLSDVEIEDTLEAFGMWGGAFSRRKSQMGSRPIKMTFATSAIGCG